MSDKARGVGRVIDAQQVFDGAGVRLRRSIASRALSYHDPFLLLDEMHSDDPDDYIAGFPTHPHRGIETVTYMLHGVMHHEDSTGNGGDIGPGSVQWMTAGRGILHSEIPRQEDGLLWGFQLWVNLPAAQKMRDPRYQEVAAEKIPEVELDGGGLVRVIAGDLGGVSGAVRDIVVDPLFVDLRLPAGTSVQIPVDPEHNGLRLRLRRRGALRRYARPGQATGPAGGRRYHRRRRRGGRRAAPALCRAAAARAGRALGAVRDEHAGGDRPGDPRLQKRHAGVNERGGGGFSAFFDSRSATVHPECPRSGIIEGGRGAARCAR